jgi:hypothetical protein
MARPRGQQKTGSVNEFDSSGGSWFRSGDGEPRLRRIFSPGCHIPRRTGGNSSGVIMTEVKPDTAETRGLLEQVALGDRSALGRLLQRYRPRLQAFIEAAWTRGCGRAWTRPTSFRRCSWR